MNRVRRLAAAGAMLAALAGAPSAWAQVAANGGQIVGTVVDSGGGAVAGADISVRSAETNLLRRTKSDSAGRFAVTLLPLGTFEITAEAPGLAASRVTVTVTT